jgi:hypothetical protein
VACCLGFLVSTLIDDTDHYTYSRAHCDTTAANAADPAATDFLPEAILAAIAADLAPSPAAAAHDCLPGQSASEGPPVHAPSFMPTAPAYAAPRAPPFAALFVPEHTTVGTGPRLSALDDSFFLSVLRPAPTPATTLHADAAETGSTWTLGTGPERGAGLAAHGAAAAEPFAPTAVAAAAAAVAGMDSTVFESSDPINKPRAFMDMQVCVCVHVCSLTVALCLDRLLPRVLLSSTHSLAHSFFFFFPSSVAELRGLPSGALAGVPPITDDEFERLQRELELGSGAIFHHDL